MALKRSRWLVAMLLSGLAAPLLWVRSSAAQSPAGQTPSTAPQEAPALEPAVMETLKRMSDLLKGATSFTFTYRPTREQVAQTGQIVDFLHVARVALTRPNQLRIDVTGTVWNTILRTARS